MTVAAAPPGPTAPAPDPLLPPRVAPRPAPSPQPVLLIVDDEPAILSALRRLFRPHGYRILSAESGAAGLEIAAREPIDLVISDMRMPQMDGAAFLTRMREAHPGAVRILLTGYADINATIAAINEGEIHRYIAKPWDDNDIVLLVREAVNRQALERENLQLAALSVQQQAALHQFQGAFAAHLEREAAGGGPAGQPLPSAPGGLPLLAPPACDPIRALLNGVAGLLSQRPALGGDRLAAQAVLARHLGRRLGLDADTQVAIQQALPLLDLGRIGFHDAMFSTEPAQMSAVDAERHRRHPDCAARLLRSLPGLTAVADIVGAQHERFDGRGFPAGLVGTAIPVGARVIALVRDFDQRRGALGLADPPAATPAALDADSARVLAELDLCAGHRHDPALVQALRTLLEQDAAALGRELLQAGPPGPETACRGCTDRLLCQAPARP